MFKYLIILFLIFLSASFAQDKYFEMTRADFKADKVKYITLAMNLSDEESSKFWPIYREYDLKMSKHGDEIYNLIKDYAVHYDNIDNKKAEEIMNRHFELKETILKIKKEYYKKFSKALSPVIAARFIQITNEIDNFINVQIDSQLPLIGGKTDNTGNEN